jgi:hypothetical protein
VANTLSRALSSPAFFCESGFFCETGFFLKDDIVATRLHLREAVDSFAVADHHSFMITIPCTLALSKKGPLPGTGDRRAR